MAFFFLQRDPHFEKGVVDLLLLQSSLVQSLCTELIESPTARLKSDRWLGLRQVAVNDLIQAMNCDHVCGNTSLKAYHKKINLFFQNLLIPEARTFSYPVLQQRTLFYNILNYCRRTKGTRTGYVMMFTHFSIILNYTQKNKILSQLRAVTKQKKCTIVIAV